MDIPYSNIAVRIAGWQAFAWAIIAVIIFFMTVKFPGIDWKSFTVFLLPVVFFIYYFALQMALPTACHKYGLLICKDGIPVEPKGMMLVGLIWGLMWRTFIINTLATFIRNILIMGTGSTDYSMASLPLDISLFSLTCFFSALWLIKHQLGSTTIVSAPPKIENRVDKINSLAELNPVGAVSVIQQTTSTILASTAVLSYFAIGLVQLAAIVSFFHNYWHWWLIPSILVGLFVSYIPVLGAVAGVLAAIEVWGWSWYWAVILFSFPWVIGVFGVGVTAMMELIIGKFRSR